MRFARVYSYSDRCRYYWVDATVQQELAQLRANLEASPPPLTLVSQYLPMQYEAIRTAGLRLNVEDMIQENIRAVLRVYAAACGLKKKS
jgi:D-tagatose-1,6-bisphosphate aldolase subunit GatZ/KbaZ